MSLLRWSVVVMFGLAGSAAPSSLASTAKPTVAPPQAVLAVQRLDDAPELEARVEIGPAVVYVYDEAGRVISVE